MKKLMAVAVLVLMTSTLAFAEWFVDFENTFRQKGIDDAVEQAMEEGIGPNPIVETGVRFEGLNPTNLIKALYCAGAPGQDVKAAARQYDISDLMIAAGYKKSIAECSEKLVDAQPFTPVAVARSFPGSHQNQSIQRNSASQATFSQ